MSIIYDNREEITALIDAGGWYHSWHLPKRNGFINWHSDATADRVIEILRGKALVYVKSAHRCTELAHQLEEERNRQWTNDISLPARLSRIRDIIEEVDDRCLSADGPVSPTLQEMTQEEISEIYRLSGGTVPQEDDE